MKECRHDFNYESHIDGFCKVCSKCSIKILLSEDEKFKYFAESIKHTSNHLEHMGVETGNYAIEVKEAVIDASLCKHNPDE